MTTEILGGLYALGMAFMWMSCIGGSVPGWQLILYALTAIPIWYHSEEQKQWQQRCIENQQKQENGQ